MKFAYIFEPPFNYQDREGRVLGHDVEVARHVARALGHDFEPVETTFPNMLAGLASGAWDMTTGLFATPERAQVAAFTRPIWALGDGLLLAKSNPLKLNTYKDIAEHPHARLAAIHGQVQLQRGLDSGLPPERLVLFDDYTDAATAVKSGAAEVYASVGRAHSGFLAQNPDWPLEVVTVPSHEAPPALGSFAVARGRTDWLDQVNACLAAYIGSPEHRRMAAPYGFSDADIDASLI